MRHAVLARAVRPPAHSAACTSLRVHVHRMVPQQLEAILSDVRAASNIQRAQIGEGAEVLQGAVPHTDKVGDGEHLEVREVSQMAHRSSLHATAGSQIEPFQSGHISQEFDGTAINPLAALHTMNASGCAQPASRHQQENDHNSFFNLFTHSLHCAGRNLDTIPDRATAAELRQPQGMSKRARRVHL